jgi:actin-related protein 5
LTGGFTSLPGLAERLLDNIRSIYPVGANVQVRSAKDPLLDAWKGAAKFALTSALKQYSVTRKEYQEYGGEYIKEHSLGNVFRS